MSSRVGSRFYVVASHHQSSTSTSSSDDESTECVHRGASQKPTRAMPIMAMEMMGDDIWWQMNQEFACSSNNTSDDEDDSCRVSPSRKAPSRQSTPSVQKTNATNLSEDAWLPMNQDFACERHHDEDDDNDEVMGDASVPVPQKTSVPAAEELVGDWGVWWE